MTRAPEAVEPVLHVGGVARLAHLAVADDVDARLQLLFDHVRHRRADARAERGRIDRHAFLLREHRADEIVGAREAAGVRGEDAVDAAFHRRAMLPWRAEGG